MSTTSRSSRTLSRWVLFLAIVVPCLAAAGRSVAGSRHEVCTGDDAPVCSILYGGRDGSGSQVIHVDLERHSAATPAWMEFEFHQEPLVTGSGSAGVSRTPGDLLLRVDFEDGGLLRSVEVLRYRTDPDGGGAGYESVETVLGESCGGAGCAFDAPLEAHADHVDRRITSIEANAGEVLGRTVSYRSVVVRTETSQEGAEFHGDVSLPGSDFEIDIDANIKVDHAAPSLDWANVTESRKDDLLSGANDDSFGQGAKEDTQVPAVVTGSIPPNKSDLKTFGFYEEENASGGIMHLFWTRVQDPRGTTNMDFEFNQSTMVSANGVTPVRTAGDMLVVYELSKGGTVPQLFLFRWQDGTAPFNLPCESGNSFPCWGDRTNLTASGAATGSINSSVIPAADSDGLGMLDPRTFGEASIDLNFVFDPSRCESFGSAYLKSRSSDSFTAASKDFIAPQPVSITNCGQVIIRKQTIPDGATETFDFTHDVMSDPPNSTSFALMDDGSETLNNVLAGGPYTVTEADPSGLGFDLTDIDCSASSADVTVTTDLDTRSVSFDLEVDQVVDCTFTNTGRGFIRVAKETLPDGDPATFDFTGDVVATLGDGDASSLVQVEPGTYTATETVPAGWDLTGIVCSDGNSSGELGTATATFQVEAGESVTCTFTNTKRGNIQVAKETVPDGDPAGFDFSGDINATLSDGRTSAPVEVAPGTYMATEAVPSGWDLTGIECSDGNSSGDTGTATATYQVEPGETVTCTFTNTKRGAIVVAKETLPDGDPATFDFSGDVLATLSDGQASDPVEVVPGSYSASETVPPGWDLTQISCDDGASATPSSGDPATGAASFHVDPGETVTCTFTNRKAGSIRVAKETNPDGSAQTFDFTGDVVASLSDGQASGAVQVEPGQYSASEALPPGWALDSIECDDADSDGDLASATATFNVEPGENVTCTFTNSTGAILISKTTQNKSAPSGSSPLEGVTFEVRDESDVLVATVDTDASGQACVGGLSVGVSYTITEVAAPAGYDPFAVDPLVVAAAGAECGPPIHGTPADASFVNIPLSELEFIFRSLAGEGVTEATIQCQDIDGQPLDLPHDVGRVLTDLPPGTYTCTIVIDP